MSAEDVVLTASSRFGGGPFRPDYRDPYGVESAVESTSESTGSGPDR